MMVVSSARGYLNRENITFPVCLIAPGCLVSRVRFGCSALPARLFSTSRPSLVPLHATASSGTFVCLWTSNEYIKSCNRHTDGVHYYRESAGIGPMLSRYLDKREIPIQMTPWINSFAPLFFHTCSKEVGIQQWYDWIGLD